MINYSLKIVILCIISLVCESSAFSRDYSVRLAFDMCLRYSFWYCRGGKWCRSFKKMESCDKPKCSLYGTKKKCSTQRVLKDFKVPYVCRWWPMKWCTKNVGRWVEDKVCKLVKNTANCLRWAAESTSCKIRGLVPDLRNCVGGWIKSVKCDSFRVRKLCMRWATKCKFSYHRVGIRFKECGSNLLPFVH